MYQSQQYLEIAGKFIVNPFKEDEMMYGVCLNRLLLRLHESGASHMSDFKSVILTEISYQAEHVDWETSTIIFKHIVSRLSQVGVVPTLMDH